MTIKRWKITTENRIGMVNDVINLIAMAKIRILSMEVLPGNIWIKFEPSHDSPDPTIVRDTILTKLADVNDIKVVALLPQEAKELQIKMILDTVSEGIIAVDKEAIVTHANPMAEKLFNLQSGEAMNKKLKDIIVNDSLILKTLETGEAIDNKQVVIKKGKEIIHYITTVKPITIEEEGIYGAVAVVKGMKEVQKLIQSVNSVEMCEFSGIVYCSDAMHRIVKLAKAVAKNDSTVLIQGESGTGKELLARAIHECSNRNNRPFLPINCAALPETLLESELFGYEGGAFSGAKKEGKPGLFEIADKGTLFLDEIGELTLKIQSKLLRALQEGKIIRVGGGKYIPVDVRIIAATNRNLDEMVKNKEFRIDLFYRLNVIPITIPPLNKRKEDIPILLDHFINKYNRIMKKNVRITAEAMEIIMNHCWYGNVRELENVIERAFNLCNDEMLTPDNLLLENSLNSTKHQLDYREGVFKESIHELEKTILVENLKTYGSARAAAKALGLSHTAVLKKIRRYNLQGLIN